MPKFEELAQVYCHQCKIWVSSWEKSSRCPQCKKKLFEAEVLKERDRNRKVQRRVKEKMRNLNS